MAIIHFTNLDPELKRAIENKFYNEEEIVRINTEIKTTEKKKIKAFRITMSLVTALLLIGGIIIYGSEIGFPDALPLLLLNMLVVAIVAPVVWYAAIGRMKKQYDDLMRLYYPAVYMDNEYGKIDQSADEPENPIPVTKAKPAINRKSAAKKVYYIITIILSVLVIVLLLAAEFSSINSSHSDNDMAGTCTLILIAGIAAGFLFLSVKGLLRNCYIPGIILEKAGILFIGFCLIVFTTGLFSHGKMLEALAIAVPAFIIGIVCFIIGKKLINKKRGQQ